MPKKPLQTEFSVSVVDRVTGKAWAAIVSGEPGTQTEAEVLVFVNNAVGNSLHPGCDVVPLDQAAFDRQLRVWVSQNQPFAQVVAKGLVRLEDHISDESSHALDVIRSVPTGGSQA